MFMRSGTPYSVFGVNSELLSMGGTPLCRWKALGAKDRECQCIQSLNGFRFGFETEYLLAPEIHVYIMPL